MSNTEGGLWDVAEDGEYDFGENCTKRDRRRHCDRFISGVRWSGWFLFVIVKEVSPCYGQKVQGR